jgi:hypothetical protein
VAGQHAEVTGEAAAKMHAAAANESGAAAGLEGMMGGVGMASGGEGTVGPLGMMAAMGANMMGMAGGKGASKGVMKGPGVNRDNRFGKGGGAGERPAWADDPEVQNLIAEPKVQRALDQMRAQGAQQVIAGMQRDPELVAKFAVLRQKGVFQQGTRKAGGKKIRSKPIKPRPPTGSELLLPGGSKRWPKGSTITITGLVGAAGHNGKRATIHGFAEEKGRYVVELAGGAKIRLKPENALLEQLAGGQMGPEPSVPNVEEIGAIGLDIPAAGGTKPMVPGLTPGKSLIQEVVPKLDYDVVRDGTQLVVSISLLGRRSAKGVDLAVSATALTVEVEGFEKLLAALPSTVDMEQVHYVLFCTASNVVSVGSAGRLRRSSTRNRAD